MKPIGVHDGIDLDSAVDGAVDKLWRALDHELGRLDDSPGRTPADREIATTRELQELERRGAQEPH